MDIPNINVDIANLVLLSVLVGTAIAAVMFAKHNLGILREHNRRNTFLSLMNQIADKRERENREIVMEKFQEDTSAAQLEAWIDTGRAAERENRGDRSVMQVPGLAGAHVKNIKDIKNAIEETIACFDKVGYFLLGRDTKFLEESPDWIWEMTDKMWSRLGNYVIHKQKSEPNWGKYFKELADIASKKSTKVKLNHDTQGGT